MASTKARRSSSSEDLRMDETLLSEILKEQRELRTEVTAQGRDVSTVKAVVSALPIKLDTVIIALDNHRVSTEARLSKIETAASIFQGASGYLAKGLVLAAGGSLIAAAIRYVVG